MRGPEFHDKMAVSIPAKLFWANQIDPAGKAFFDFGCGDGRLLREYARLAADDLDDLAVDAPAITGYDIVEAPAQIPVHHDLTRFTDTMRAFRRSGFENVLIFSSVLHEAPSLVDIAAAANEADWIVVRDFRPIGFDAVSEKDRKLLVDAIYKAGTVRTDGFWQQKAFYRWRRQPGDLPWEFCVRYLLAEMWPTELNEDYFRVTGEWLYGTFRSFETVYTQTPDNPWLQEKVAESAASIGYTGWLPPITNWNLIYKRKPTTT